MSQRNLIIWVIGALGASASAAEQLPTTLPEIMVIREQMAPEPPSRRRFELKAIETGIVADAGDLLRRLPGVDGSRMGGHGIDPIIRGQSQNQLNILVEGAHAFGGCPNRMDPPTTLFDLDSYDSLTLIKGSQSVRYGGGGSGGTILFERRTPRFGEDEGVRAHVAGGLGTNANSQSASADIAIGNPIGFARATGSYKHADDYEDGDGNSVRSAYDSEAAGLILGLTPNADTRIELSYDATHDWDMLYAGAGMDSPYSNTNQWRLNYEQDLSAGPLRNLSLDLYSIDVDHLMNNYSLRTLTSPMKMRVPTRSNSAGGRLVAEMNSADIDWTLGLDYLVVEREATRYWNYRSMNVDVPQSHLWPDVSQSDLGLFVEATRPVGADGQLDAGLRYDQVESGLSSSRANSKPTGPAWVLSPNQLYSTYYGHEADDETEHNLGGFLRYGQDLGEGLRISANLSRSVRTADATERYLAANGYPASMRWVGNPNLDPEQHHQLEIGAAKTADSWRGDLTLFYNRVTDFILRDRAHGQSGILMNDNATIYRNVEAELMGAEWSAELQFATAWTAGASMAYVHAQNRTDDRAIAQIPPLSGQLRLDYAQPRWSLGAQVSWSATQTRVDDDPMIGSGLDTGETAGWWVLDLYGQARIGRHAKIMAGVDNLFDRNYVYHVNRANLDPFNPQSVQVNEPGRTLWMRAAMDL